MIGIISNKDFKFMLNIIKYVVSKINLAYVNGNTEAFTILEK